MTAKQRDKVATLERRRDFLANRIENYDLAGDPSRDKAECSALSWALRVVSAAEHHGILRDLESVAA